MNDDDGIEQDNWGYRDRDVLVTGAASGMGAAVVGILTGFGARVHAFDLQPVESPVASQTVVDLADPASIDGAVATLRSVTENVSALFNCAGVPGTFDRRVVYGVNFCGLRHLTEQLVAGFAPGSAICSVGSTSAVSWPFHVDDLRELLATGSFDDAMAWFEANSDRLGYPYDVTKEAVNVYTSARALTLVEQGIRMNCVNPGGTRTPATPEFAKAMRAKDHGEEMLKAYPRLMGRLATPIEQAWPMVFLNSPLASYVNGTTLNVDAGLTGGLFTASIDPAVARGMKWHQPR